MYGLVVSFLLILLVPISDSIFAQQFEEPNYEIRGGKVLGFEIDPETASLIISLDAKSRGELIITLPRNLIDAKNGPDDSDFNILVSGINLNFFDETTTETDRTVTIPFGRSDFEVIITGTQIFSQITPAQTTQSKVIEQIIQEELEKEIPENQAKLLIFSDTEWSGALQSTSYDFSEIVGQSDTSILFGCEPSFGGEGMFGAKIQKTTQDGYLKIVAIQNQKIMAQGSTEAPFGEVLINGNCVSNFNSGPQGGGCLIATATFGSELSPQIQQLRELRDNKLLQTESGLAFMQTFNEFYYSFSPYIADYERENPLFREAVKITITPMISSLSILNHVDINSEFEVLTYGISLILLNIGMYFAVPAILIVSIKKNRKKIS